MPLPTRPIAWMNSGSRTALAIASRQKVMIGSGTLAWVKMPFHW